MAAEYNFDDFNRLTADLGSVEKVSPDHLRTAVQVTSNHVKDGWNQRLYSDGHASRTRGTISYDTEITRNGVEGEIGPYETRVQSGIVKLLETGSINNPAHGYGAAALHENEDDFQRGIEKAIDDSLKQAGL